MVCHCQLNICKHFFPDFHGQRVQYEIDDLKPHLQINNKFMCPFRLNYEHTVAQQSSGDFSKFWFQGGGGFYKIGGIR